MDVIERDLERYGALARMLERWADKAESSFMKAWINETELGFTNGAFTIVERGLGYAVAEKINGIKVTVYAPVPFA